MKYTVVLSRQAENFYRKLGKKEKGQVRDCLIALETDAYLGKRLHGDLKGYCSLRAGKLRVVYAVLEKDKIVHIIAIGPRKTIYGQPL